MNSHRPQYSPPVKRKYPSRLAFLCGLACAASLGAAHAQSDDFNAGNDTGWSRYSPLADFGVPGAFSFPGGGYRIQTAFSSPDPENLGNGRAGSLRTNVYSDFYISVDVVDWADSLPQAFGILARIGTPGLGTTTGYVFTWSRDVSSDDAVVDITKITGELPDDVSTSGSDHYYLAPGHKYRLVFIGKGTRLEGRVYELPDVLHPVVTIVGYDGTYGTGMGGLLVYDNSSAANNLADATFDNYTAYDVEPPRLEITGPDSFGDIKITWPAESYAGGFKLQVATSFPATSWEDISDHLIGDEASNPPRVVYYPEDPAAGPKFYRLRRP